MIIAGLQPISMIDFPGFISAIVFTQGCNLRCGYCHNPQLIDCGIPSPQITETEVLKYCEKRRNMIEGIVISGGEPTLQSDLEQFITRIRRLDLKIKLDTNGTHPEIIENLLHNNLLDFVALDIKAPPAMYNQICGKMVNTENIAASLQLLKQGSIEYELRTTLTSELSLSNLYAIQNWIKDCSHWVLQKCRPVNNKFNKVTVNWSEVSNITALTAAFPGCLLRGFD
jgi:pyruvate formate lyase activating enzyme